MFKKIALAAALAAGFAGVAQAQSNITIYGRLNVTVERVEDAAGDSETVMNDNSSRIGFKGTEDIGGGLKANFVIEHGFDATNGAAASNAFWNREATVGLSGNFGAVRLGNMPASEAYFATADYISMHNHDTGLSSDFLYALGFRITTGKLQNTVAYTSPTFSGLRLDAQVGIDNAVDRPIALAGNYDAGPVHIGVGVEDFNGLRSVTVRGLYEMGAITLGAYVERNSGDDATIVDASRTNLRFAAMYAIGAGELHANIGAAGEVGDVADSDARQYTLGYNYNLSKRTKIYGYYTKLEDDSGFYGGEFSSIAVGLRHNF